MKKNSLNFFIAFIFILIIFTNSPAYVQAADNSFTYEDIVGGISITGYLGSDGEITIPSTIDGKIVTEIGSQAFINYSGTNGKPNITSVTIPETVITIGNSAFSSCMNLTEVNFSESAQLESIGDDAFCDTDLASIRIPNGVTTIGNSVFDDCHNLTTINIPASTTSVGTMYLEGCRNMQSINVDPINSFYSSENGVFFNKNKTKLIAYPKNKEGTSYSIPGTVTTIDALAFFYNIQLEEVILPKSLSIIEAGSFTFSRNLKSIIIPQSVSRLGEGAFMSCVNLNSVTILNKDLALSEDGFYFHATDEEPSALTIHGYVGSTAETYSNLFDAHTFEPIAENPLPSMSGDGSIEAPYEVVYIEQLQSIGSGNYGLDKSYILKNNLDFNNDNSYYNFNKKDSFINGLGFKPIGDIEAMDFDPNIHTPFSGTFDGNGKTISNLYINRPLFETASAENGGITVGLFGGTMGSMATPCIIKDLELVTPNVTGGNRVGALAAASMFTKFENCYITGGSVIGTAEPAIETEIENFIGRTASTGGMLGMVYAKGSGIYNCFSSATVTGTDCVGGLVGYNYGNKIQRCVSKGSVNGSKYVGGLVGCNIGSAMEMPPNSGNYTYFYAEIENSYATGNVTATSNMSNTGVGGLVGYNHVFANINNSYALGNVNGTNNCGGLVGENNLGAISYCYAMGNVSGTGNSVGGLIGLYQSVSSNGGTPTVLSYSTALKNSIAFNSQVSASGTDIGRIIGKCLDSETVSNCYSNEKMIISENQNQIISSSNISQKTFINPNFYKISDNWNGNSWDLENIWLITTVRPLLKTTDSTITNVTITGLTQVGETLTGSYEVHNGIKAKYNTNITFKWFSAIDANGTSKREISNASSSIYTLDSSNKDSYIAFEVATSDKNNTDFTFMSSWFGPITETSSGHSSHHTSTNNNSSTGANVYVNGEKHTAGKTETTKVNGNTITKVTVDPKKLEALLNLKQNGSTVTIPIINGADKSSGILTGQMIKNMEKKEAILEIKTSNANYTIPASEFDIDTISKKFTKDVNLSDIKVAISISSPSVDTVEIVNNIAKKQNFSIIIKPIEFTIACSYQGNEFEINNFKSYVSRTIEIPNGEVAKKITTAIIVEPNSEIRHIPTQVIEKEGSYYAIINSLTNSIYTLIYNPIEFEDVSKHWARNAVNNMASRKIINGYANGNYNPNADITRAEFASLIVRALGLKKCTETSYFKDINESNWFYSYVETASKYGFIEGYPDDTFRPNNKITREQAMTMISRAMNTTGLETELTDSKANTILTPYTDASSISNYAKSSIATCLETEVVHGTSNNKLEPKHNITRAEVAIILERLLQKSELI